MGDLSAAGVSLKELSAAEFSRLSAVWDESIEMAPAERDAWFAALERSDPKIAALLRALSTSQDESRERGFLETRDLVAGHVASLIEADPGLVGRQFGPYRVLSLLGQGGMGSVWLAERADGLFTRRVALKLIHPSLKSRVMSERFAREREILASLNHAHIARLLDAGVTDDGQSYLALDYVSGAPITSYCDEHRLSVHSRLELFRQVLSAVQYAHAHLVVHRDLKPANILVTAEGQVQLLDFGIAKLLSEGEAKETELTQVGGRALTPDYAAPEQIIGAPVTTAADVYALGVMLYELLTGERPYKLKRDSRGALEEAILEADPAPPSRLACTAAVASARATMPKKLASTLRGDLDTIVGKALKKSPTERYATANAFAEDIERFLRGDVVLAQPDSVVYRTFKFARRHWVGISATSVLILTLAAGLAATSYEARVAAAERDAVQQSQLRSLTQTAAGRLKDSDVPEALAIILEVVSRGDAGGGLTPEALSVFQEARARDTLESVLAGQSSEVNFAAFSPDGRRLITVDSRTARIWDLESGRQLVELAGHTAEVQHAEFSPDGERVLTASWDKTARLWDANTGRQILVLTGHDDKLRSAAFSPDGKRIVTGSYDRTARIWDSVTGRELMRLSGHASPVADARFSSDGLEVVTASVDRTVRIWSSVTGRERTRLIGHTDAALRAAFSPDGKRIATSSADKTARIWDASSGRELFALRHQQLVESAEFSPDGSLVATASGDSSLRLWEVATGKEIMVMDGHRAGLMTAAFSRDGQHIVTASMDETARVWGVAALLPTITLSGHRSAVESAQFSPDGRRIVTASDDSTARIWDAATGRELIALVGHREGLWSASFSRDGARVITASSDGTARIWDAASGIQAGLLAGHDSAVESAQFSADGRRVVTSSTDKTARIWDVDAAQPAIVLRGHKDRVSGAVFSPDHRHVATASIDATARIWDVASGRQTLAIDAQGAVFTVAYSPDGRRLVTASLDMSARIWDGTTGEGIRSLTGHSQLVGTANFSPDGRRVLTASPDKTARIWDAETGQQLAVFQHPDSVNAAAYSADGSRVVTASDDALVRVWDARVPSLESQIAWVTAAMPEVLAPAERYRLGLPRSVDVRSWPADRSKCDDSAAAPYDPDRRASGVSLDRVIVDAALAACGDELKRRANSGRSWYLHARAQEAAGHLSEARVELERAVQGGYRAARIDLAALLARPPSGVPDLPRAISLYEQAWNDGVTVAAFDLGELYERGVSVPGRSAEMTLAADGARAWDWYRRGAAAGDPAALARIAFEDESVAVPANETAKQNALRLEAFRYYASASERARLEDWPDNAWRSWRYRRASLARLLARAGMMQDVADVYVRIQKQYSTPPTPWERLTSLLRIRH